MFWFIQHRFVKIEGLSSYCSYSSRNITCIYRTRKICKMDWMQKNLHWHENWKCNISFWYISCNIRCLPSRAAGYQNKTSSKGCRQAQSLLTRFISVGGFNSHHNIFIRRGMWCSKRVNACQSRILLRYTGQKEEYIIVRYSPPKEACEFSRPCWSATKLQKIDQSTVILFVRLCQNSHSWQAWQAQLQDITISLLLPLHCGGVHILHHVFMPICYTYLATIHESLLFFSLPQRIQDLWGLWGSSAVKSPPTWSGSSHALLSFGTV